MNKNIIYIILAVVLIYLIMKKTLNKFDLFMPIIFKHEGGYVNDPDDLGGETKYGITKRRYPNLDIKNLTKEKAKELYYKDFYVPMEVEKIKNLNLALNYFDMGINAGIKNAKAIMGQAVSLSEKTGADIVKCYKDLRKEYYKKVATYRNNQKFLTGWLRRVDSSIITV